MRLDIPYKLIDDVFLCVLLLTGASEDSGLGGSSPDVIVLAYKLIGDVVFHVLFWLQDVIVCRPRDAQDKL